MQAPDNDELAAHLAGELGERRPTYLLEVDWDGTGSWMDLSSVVSELTVERSLTGDLPEEAGLIDGLTSASLEATLEGSWEAPDGTVWPITTALSPFVPGSLREGRQLVTATVRASMGAVLTDGPVQLVQFTGPIRIVSGNDDAGTVKLSGVDPSDRLRAPITLPTYGEFVTHASRRPWKLTINTQWLLHHVLAQNGIHASPPPRDEAIIVASGHGGLAANRGFNGAPISLYGAGPRDGVWTEDGHPYGMLGTPESPDGGTIGYQEFYGVTDGVTPPLRFQAGYGVGVSSLLHVSGAMGYGSSVENRLIQVRPTNNDYPRLFVNGYGNGDLYAGLTTGDGLVYATPRIPTARTPAWRFAGWHWRFPTDTTLEIRARIDGQTRLWTLNVPRVVINANDHEAGYRPLLQVNGQLARSWSNLQAWPAYDPPPAGEWQGERHTPQASIARGLNELRYLPDVTNADSWDLMKAGVAAEYGVHGFDETGWYSFRPRTDVRDPDVDVELDVLTNLSDVKWSTSTDSVRNVVGITTQDAYHAGEFSTVVKAEDPLEFVCQPGTTTFTLDWPYGAAGYQGGILPYHYQEGADTAARDAPYFAKWDGDVVHGWTYSSIGASGGWTILDNNRSVVLVYCQTGARTAQLVVSNPGPGPIRLATAANATTPDTQPGEPAMRIGGWPLEKQTDHVEQVRAPASQIDAQRGERVLTLNKTDWTQDPDAYRELAGQLVRALNVETATLEDLTITGDPRLQDGDVALCRFPNGAASIVGTIVTTKPKVADDGLTGTVSVRPLPAPTLAPPGWTFYVDISHYQGDAGPIDLASVKRAGYGGAVVKVGQGGGTDLGALIDPWWPTFRDQAMALWPNTTAGYWMTGDQEAPADQAARCLAAIGDPSIPLMLDWEDPGGGDWSALVAVLDAFRAAGLMVTMLYTRQSYAEANGAQGIGSTGLSLVNSRYWLDSAAYPSQDPVAVFADIQATRPSFGFGTFAGGTVAALQFTDAGVVYPGWPIDVNAYPGTADELAAMFHGR